MQISCYVSAHWRNVCETYYHEVYLDNQSTAATVWKTQIPIYYIDRISEHKEPDHCKDKRMNIILKQINYLPDEEQNITKTLQKEKPRQQLSFLFFHSKCMTYDQNIEDCMMDNN